MPETEKIPERDELPKVLFVDIDGTLVTGSEHYPSDENVASLMEAHKAGIQVIFASGRTRSSVLNVIKKRPELEPLFEGYPGVYQNGCVVLANGGNTIYKGLIMKEVFCRIFSFVHEFFATRKVDPKTWGMLCFTPIDDIYTPYVNHWTDSSAHHFENVPIPRDDIPEMSQEFTKILMFLDNDANTLRELRENLTDKFGSEVSFTSASSTSMEVLPYNCSKGAGCLKLLKEMQILPEQAAAVGDGENDIEMLSYCKKSFAMGQAKSTVKKAAAYETSTAIDHGLSCAIKTIFTMTS